MEYDKDKYVWFDLENACIDWCLHNNCIDILFYDCPPPQIDKINDGNQEPFFPTSLPLTYSPVEVLALGDALLDIDDCIYVDPHDQFGHLEHNPKVKII